MAKPQKKYRRKPRASGATAFVIRTALLCCLLLVINAVLCQFLVVLLRGMMPPLFEDLRLVQGIMFFGPVLLICIEFWIYDRRVDYLARKHPAEDLESWIVSDHESDF